MYIPPPDETARLAILTVHTRDLPLADNVSLDSLSKRTQRFSGADLHALCRTAARNALITNIDAKV